MLAGAVHAGGVVPGPHAGDNADLRARAALGAGGSVGSPLRLHGPGERRRPQGRGKQGRANHGHSQSSIECK